MFDPVMVFLKEFFEKADFEKTRAFVCMSGKGSYICIFVQVHLSLPCLHMP